MASKITNRGGLSSAPVDQDTHEAGFTDAELQKLQRQFRILEADRKSYGTESKSALYKQKTTIESMKKENMQLQELIRLTQTKTDPKFVTIKGHKMTPEDQKEAYLKKIKGLGTEIEEMDEIIEKKMQMIEIQRQNLGGVNAASENIDSIDKQIKIMENRLDKALVKYNKSLATNKKFRDTIDNLRRERITFDKLSKTFQKEENVQKKFMSDLIEQSNSAYEARSEAQARLMTLREKSEKEFQAFSQEIKELDRSIEHDRRLQDFLLAKAVDRVERESHESSKKPSKKDKDGNLTGLTSNESLNTVIEGYNKTMKELEAQTGELDIKVILNKFKSVDEDNFSLFIYVNEINNEVEKLANEHAKMETNIRLISEGQAKKENERDKVLKGIEMQFEVCTALSEGYVHSHAELDMTLRSLIASVNRIVETMRGISSPFVEDVEVGNGVDEDENSTNVIKGLIGNVGQKVQVTEENIVRVLGLIESESNDVVTLNHIFTFSKKNNTTTALNTEENVTVVHNAKMSMPLPGTIVKLVSSKALPPLKRVLIQPPTSVGDDEIEEEIKILSRTEVKSRVASKLAQKSGGK